MNTTSLPADRFILKRNPYYHRVDPEGRQLTNIDRDIVNTVNKRLIAAKTNAGKTRISRRDI